jgi:hypothetical protein
MKIYISDNDIWHGKIQNSPVGFVFSPCPASVERGSPGVWLCIVIERIVRIGIPCLKSGGKGVSPRAHYDEN